MFEKAFRGLHTPYMGGPVSGDYLGPLGEALPESLVVGGVGLQGLGLRDFGYMALWA